MFTKAVNTYLTMNARVVELAQGEGEGEEERRVPIGGGSAADVPEAFSRIVNLIMWGIGATLAVTALLLFRKAAKGNQEDIGWNLAFLVIAAIGSFWAFFTADFYAFIQWIIDVVTP